MRLFYQINISYSDQAIDGVGDIGPVYMDNCLYLFLTTDIVNQHPEIFCFQLPVSGTWAERLALCYNPLITTGKIKMLEDRKRLEGNLDGDFDLFGTYTFTTNQQNQLIKVTMTSGRYVEEWSYSYDKGGRLIAYDGHSLEYDSDGNLTSFKPDTYSFQYKDDKLTSVTVQSQDYEGNTSFQYTYDSANRVSSCYNFTYL